MEFFLAVVAVFVGRMLFFGRHARDYTPDVHAEKGPRCSLEEADRLADEWRSVNFPKNER